MCHNKSKLMRTRSRFNKSRFFRIQEVKSTTSVFLFLCFSSHSSMDVCVCAFAAGQVHYSIASRHQQSRYNETLAHMLVFAALFTSRLLFFSFRSVLY